MAEVVAITGGASGIGLACVEACLAKGWHVAVGDRDEAAIATARGALPDDGRVTFTPLDVVDDAAVDAWVGTAAARGRLIGVVASAGIAAVVPALETSVELFRRIHEVNVLGTFIVCTAAARRMRESGGGALVNIASVAGLRGSEGRSAYGSSKAAVINLSQVLAVDLARHGIRCNAVCPGPIETPMVQRVHTPATRAAWLANVPMRRYGTPAEVARLVAFLLDGALSGYLTGEAIAVDGGFRGAGLTSLEG